MFVKFDKLEHKKTLLEIAIVTVVLLIALFVGFYDADNLTHPLHGDLLIEGNAVFNIHNHIPFEVDGKLQWIDERSYYFYVSPLNYYFKALFWNNSRNYIDNSTPPVVWGVLFTYLMTYFFARRYFGQKVATTALFLMALSSYWYNYVIRSLYCPWAFLPGITILVYWLYLSFHKTGRFKLMLLAGFLAGLAFYFVTWPFVIFVIPSIFLLIFFFPFQKNAIAKRFLGFLIFIGVFAFIVAAKELIFNMTGLRYKGDASGVETFCQIFFQGRWNDEKIAGAFSLINVIKKAGLNFISVLRMIFIPTDIYPGGNLVFVKPLDVVLPLMTPLVTASLVPGMIWMFIKKNKDCVFKILPFVVVVTVCMLSGMLAAPAPRYLLTIFPFVYIIAAYVIVGIYEYVKNDLRRKQLFIAFVSCFILFNAKETFSDYMGKVLPIYFKFEYNCYNSIQWPFDDLKKFLNDKREDYDIVVIPNNFTPQMISFFRLWPWFVQVDGKPPVKVLASYDGVRKGLAYLRQARFKKMLIIANTYNRLLNDEICPGWSNLVPFDKTAITEPETKILFPQAKFIKYVGCKQYPNMLALFEVEGPIK
ncbi:MAG: glycosyltransferase family 39 protein [Candidatus Omnitrophica bacterium]|nr:glycosyltransferase family 39 protein [Candidatus Omnitrophota bacterium]